MNKIEKSSSEHDPEKEELWKKTALEVDRITDSLGHGVDANIKEAVVAFMVNGFPTFGSCEGHLEKRFGYRMKTGPFVSTGLRVSPRYVGEQEIREVIAKQFGVNPADIDMDENPKADESYWDYIETHNSEETHEYKTTREKNEVLRKKFSELFLEFLNKRGVQETHLDIRKVGPDGCFKVYGEVTSPEDQDIPESEMPKYQKALDQEQKEMADLSEFLKEKFFSEK